MFLMTIDYVILCRVEEKIKREELNQGKSNKKKKGKFSKCLTVMRL